MVYGQNAPSYESQRYQVVNYWGTFILFIYCKTCQNDCYCININNISNINCVWKYRCKNVIKLVYLALIANCTNSTKDINLTELASSVTFIDFMEILHWKLLNLFIVSTWWITGIWFTWPLCIYLAHTITVKHRGKKT